MDGSWQGIGWEKNGIISFYSQIRHQVPILSLNSFSVLLLELEDHNPASGLDVSLGTRVMGPTWQPQEHQEHQEHKMDIWGQPRKWNFFRTQNMKPEIDLRAHLEYSM